MSASFITPALNALPIIITVPATVVFVSKIDLFSDEEPEITANSTIESILSTNQTSLCDDDNQFYYNETGTCVDQFFTHTFEAGRTKNDTVCPPNLLSLFSPKPVNEMF